jgi:proline iminopeptidase
MHRILIGILSCLLCSAGSVSQSAAADTTTTTKHPPGAYASVTGVKLWYESEGSGAPLVLIAGGPGFSHSYFHPWFSDLARSYRVIYFDSFGRGKSDRAANPREYTFDRDVNGIEHLRQALGLRKMNLLGHSYGGMVAIAYALRYPESVDKLILADILLNAESWQANNDNWNLQIRNQYPEVWDQLSALRERGKRSCTKEYQDVQNQIPLGLFYFYDGSAADKLLRSIEPQSLDVYCSIAGDDADVLIAGDIGKLDFRVQIGKLRMPILVLAGRFDRLSMPRFSLQLKHYAPKARFVMFEKSGHLPFIEETESLVYVVRDFLGK